jgi:hypothetical protein
MGAPFNSPQTAETIRRLDHVENEGTQRTHGKTMENTRKKIRKLPKNLIEPANPNAHHILEKQLIATYSNSIVLVPLFPHHGRLWSVEWEV